MSGAPGILVHKGDGEAIADREEREHSDAFYVLEGELTFGLGPAGDVVRVPAGGFVAAPPNLAHSFANEGGAEARFLNLHAPDTGFVGSLRARRDGGDPSYDQFDPPADGGRPRDDAIVSGPGEGERLVSGNRIALMKGVLDDLSLAEWTIEGRFEGPPLHRHESGADSFYVIEGELEMTIEDSIHVAGPGTLACVPPGVLHTFNHLGPGTVRFLNVHAPDEGFAAYLRSISD